MVSDAKQGVHHGYFLLLKLLSSVLLFLFHSTRLPFIYHLNGSTIKYSAFVFMFVIHFYVGLTMETK